MSLMSRIGEWIMNLFRTDAESIFGAETITSKELEAAQNIWQSIIKGNPRWVGGNVRSINFGKFLCQYTAKKVCLDLSVNVDGSERAGFIKQVISDMIGKTIRDKVEDACGAGGIILKPNGNENVSNAVDYVMPWNYVITEKTSNGDIRGIIFFDRMQKSKVFYTRLEYHHFVTGEYDDGNPGHAYVIENKAYRSNSESNLGNEIPLEYVMEWAQIESKSYITNIDKPLFGYLKMPFNNTIDYDSPEGVSIFANCIEELRDLDIAWSKKGNEVEDSDHITFIDENTLTKIDPKTGKKRKTALPRFVKGLRRGVDSASTIEEHVATMLTADRVADINSILSMISTKAGFSQGQFVLDRKTGRVTATQIESDDSETVETIGDIRAALKSAIKDLVYALDKYCDLVYDLPDGYVNVLDEKVSEEDIFYFRDLLRSFEQDRTRAYQMMMSRVYSKRKYLKEYEGFSDSEVDKMFKEVAEERSDNAEPFGDE